MYQYDYARNELARNHTGRLPNGMYNAWTGQDQGYDMASVEQQRREDEELEQNRAKLFAARYAQDIKEPTTEEKIMDADSDLWETERLEGPPEQGSITMDGVESTFNKFPTRRILKPSTLQGIDEGSQLRRTGSSMTLGEYRDRKAADLETGQALLTAKGEQQREMEKMRTQRDFLAKKLGLVGSVTSKQSEYANDANATMQGGLNQMDALINQAMQSDDAGTTAPTTDEKPVVDVLPPGITEAQVAADMAYYKKTREEVLARYAERSRK